MQTNNPIFAMRKLANPHRIGSALDRISSNEDEVRCTLADFMTCTDVAISEGEEPKSSPCLPGFMAVLLGFVLDRADLLDASGEELFDMMSAGALINGVNGILVVQPNRAMTTPKGGTLQVTIANLYFIDPATNRVDPTKETAYFSFHPDFDGSVV